MSQKITFTGTGSVEIPTIRDVAEIGSLQYISGTGTVVVEGSMDGGTTWTAIGIKSALTDAIAANATAAGLFYFICAAYDKVRVRCSAFTADIIVYVNTSRST